ncbi:unnamed protein product [Sphagnum balticum]
MEVPTTHKAWTYAEYGPPGVLKLEQIPVPDVAADEVLVKVYAAALNPVDGKRRQGKLKNTDSPLPEHIYKNLAEHNKILEVLNNFSLQDSEGMAQGISPLCHR